MEPLRIFQIYFDESSRKDCFEHPLVTPFLNAELTPYFENQVILDLRPYSAEYVGVWSHKAGTKLVNAGNRRIDLDEIGRLCDAGGFDVLGFHRRRNLYPGRRGRIIFSDRHTRVRFDAMFDDLMRKLGLAYDSNTRPRLIVMGNHFVARSRVMHDYCAFLERAKHVMETDAALKSELARRAPHRPDSPLRYTFHPFVCERLFSAYLTLNPEIVCRLYQPGEPARA